MARISIYYNMKAGQSEKKLWLSEIEKILFRHDLNFKTPPSLEQLKKSIQSDIKNEIDYLFSIGGDGTANVIIQEIAGTEINLFVIPAGTANDLANELGIKQSIKAITQIFQYKSTSQIDLIDINGKYMSTNGGIGIAAKVAAKVNIYRSTVPGFKSLMGFSRGHIYNMVLAKELISSKLKYYSLEIESTHSTLDNSTILTPMLFINNQSMLGGTFNIAPDTKNTDGKFNVTIFLHKKKMDLIKCIYKIRIGQYPQNDNNLISFETDEIKISNLENSEIAFLGDGEQLQKSKNFQIKIAQQKLNFCCFNNVNEFKSNSYSLDDIANI